MLLDVWGRWSQHYNFCIIFLSEYRIENFSKIGLFKITLKRCTQWPFHGFISTSETWTSLQKHFFRSDLWLKRVRFRSYWIMYSIWDLVISTLTSRLKLWFLAALKTSVDSKLLKRENKCVFCFHRTHIEVYNILP